LSDGTVNADRGERKRVGARSHPALNKPVTDPVEKVKKGFRCNGEERESRQCCHGSAN